MKKIILGLLVLCLVVFVFTFGFKVNAFRESFYKKEFVKYGVYDKFAGKDIDKINTEVIGYLKGREISLDDGFFSAAEISHLKDVRGLVRGADILFYLSLVFALACGAGLFYLDKNLLNISRALMIGGIVSAVGVIAIIAFVIFGFDSIFTYFHYLLFSQGGWVFGATDNIVNLYTEGFFYDMGLRVFLSILAFANILILLSLSLPKWSGD